MDCSSPGSSVRGILQARILEWVDIPFSRDLPNPGTKPGSLQSPVLAGRFSSTSATWPCIYSDSENYIPISLSARSRIIANIEVTVFLQWGVLEEVLQVPNRMFKVEHWHKRTIQRWPYRVCYRVIQSLNSIRGYSTILLVLRNTWNAMLGRYYCFHPAEEEVWETGNSSRPPGKSLAEQGTLCRPLNFTPLNFTFHTPCWATLL